MTISQTPDLFEEILAGERIPSGKLTYLRARLRFELHELIVSCFLQQETLTKREFARRIGHREEVVNRLLSSPGNWTLDTVSDLLAGLGRVLVFKDQSIAGLVARGPDQKIAEMLRQDPQRGSHSDQPTVQVPTPAPPRNESQTTRVGTFLPQ